MESRAVPAPGPKDASQTVYRVLFAVSLAHLLNDSVQAVIPAVLPILEKNLMLSYLQLGVILLVMNVTASILQPVIGYVSDRFPLPFAMPIAMLVSGLGMLTLAFTENYLLLLAAVGMVGIGSAVFHPEASRVAHKASGIQRGLGQSIFQVGGNVGQSLAPLMTALVFVPLGQGGAAWFTALSTIAAAVLVYIAFWSRGRQRQSKAQKREVRLSYMNKRMIALCLVVVIVAVRSWVVAGLQSFYPLFLIKTYGLQIDQAQIFAFLFLLAGAIGTFLGGPIGDRFGKRNLLIVSTVGALPLTLLIPYAHGIWAYPLLFLTGFILLSNFSVSVVYAQELLPGRVGTVSGLIIGFAFGMGGLGATVLGYLADLHGLMFIMLLCSALPALGALGFFLPKDAALTEWEKAAA
jgi:FSR family fosmidomycin resistance protein-like MFS transporter